MKAKIEQADYANPNDAQAIKQLLNHYASDPMGGGNALKSDVLNQVVAKLSTFQTAITLIAWHGEKAVGLLNAFESFSTFKCKPLINIHDIVVLSEYRGHGIGHQLLSAIQHEAIKRDCCKLTLEVLEGNKTAQRLYQSFGFDGYQLDPEKGKALFWEKNL